MLFEKHAANNYLWMGSGVAGAIKRKGGQTIENEAIAKGPIAIGDAVTTSAGKLRAGYVIHAAAMGQDLKTSIEHIKNATLNSLRQAEELGLSSIAFPALGTGVGGFSIADCADIMLDVCAHFLVASNSVNNIHYVLFDNISYQIFVGRLKIFS